MQKYGISEQDSINARNNLAQTGKEIGFEFNFFDDMKMLNTKAAHLLIEFAAQNGKQQQAKLALITAYFSNQQDISNLDTLASIASDLDLPVDTALAFINNDDAKAEFDNEEAKWKGLGINYVPTLVFNMKEGLPGAQSIDVYKQVLKQYLHLS